jgi:hypothetical protein
MAEKVLLQASQPFSFGHKTHFQKPHNAGSRREAPFFDSLLDAVFHHPLQQRQCVGALRQHGDAGVRCATVRVRHP